MRQTTCIQTKWRSQSAALSSLRTTFFWFAGFVVVFALLLLLPALLKPTTLQFSIAFPEPADQDFSISQLESQLEALDKLISLRLSVAEPGHQADFAVTWRRDLKPSEIGPDPLEPRIRAVLRDNNLEWNRGLSVKREAASELMEFSRITSPLVWLVLAVMLLAFFYWQQRLKKTIARPASSGVNYQGLAFALIVSTPLAPIVALLIGWTSPGATDQAPFAPSFDLENLPLLISVILLIPLSEEIVFRAWLLDRLSQILTPSVALLISAVAFSAVHPMGLAANLIFLIPGLVWGYLWLRYRSLLICTVAHAAYNAVAISITSLQQG